MVVYVAVMFLQSVLVSTPSIAVISFLLDFFHVREAPIPPRMPFLEASFPLVNTVDHFLTPTSVTCDLVARTYSRPSKR